MIETGVDLNINEELTPNLYKLKTEGIDFINNHSKNKTNISEIIGIVGSVAKAGKKNGCTRWHKRRRY